MPNPRKSNRLLEAGRNIRDEMMEEGGGRVSEAVERLRARYPDVVREYSDSLARNALAEMFRKQFRESISLAHDAEQQPLIPGIAEHIGGRLPRGISIPDPTAEGESIYRSWSKATMNELRQCIDARETQLEQDAAVLRTLQELYDLREHQGARGSDLVVARELEPA